MTNFMQLAQKAIFLRNEAFYFKEDNLKKKKKKRHAFTRMLCKNNLVLESNSSFICYKCT